MVTRHLVSGSTARLALKPGTWPFKPAAVLLQGALYISQLRRWVEKSLDILFGYPVKVMVFPVVMYGYESWTIKKAEHKRIDTFELW